MSLPERIGRYRVVRELGRGGMGVVYEVQQDGLERRLALKVLLAEGEGEALARFGREAELLARFKHPNVVEVHELGRTAQGAPFLVTDLVEGEELKARLDREGPMDPTRAAALVRDVAGALAAVHGKGVLHRDLKPHNIMLRPDGTPVLLDFGVATGAEVERLTQTGTIVGTPVYMSPEQVEGAKGLDERADVYSLGATLFHLLSGAPPFHDVRGVAQLLHKILTREPRWPPKDRGVPPGLEAILRQAMAKDPAKRYPSAAALEADLRRFLGGEQVEARIPRSLGWALTVSLLALLLTGLLVVGSLGVGSGGAGGDPLEAQRVARQEEREARSALTALLREHRGDPYRLTGPLGRWIREHPTLAGEALRDDHQRLERQFPMRLAVLRQPAVELESGAPHPSRGAAFVGGSRLITFRYGSPLQAWDLSDPRHPRSLELPSPQGAFDPSRHGFRRVAGDPQRGRFWAVWTGRDGQRGLLAYDLDAGTARSVPLLSRKGFLVDGSVLLYSAELDVLVASTRQVDLTQDPPAEFTYPWRVHLEVFRPSGEWLCASPPHPLGLRWAALDGLRLLCGYGLGTDVRHRLGQVQAAELYELRADGGGIERRAKFEFPLYLPGAGALLPDGDVVLGTNGHRLFQLSPTSQAVDLERGFGRRGRLLGVAGDARQGQGEVAHDGALVGIVPFAAGTRLISASGADAPGAVKGADPGEAGTEALKETQRDARKSELRLWRKAEQGWVEENYLDPVLLAKDPQGPCRAGLVASPDRKLFLCLVEGRTTALDVREPLPFELWALEPPE